MLDDLLACTPFHLNALPTSFYCADWPSLLVNRPKALEAVDMLYARCCDVVKQQMWPLAHELVAPRAVASADELLQHVCSGFNYPVC